MCVCVCVNIPTHTHKHTYHTHVDLSIVDYQCGRSRCVRHWNQREPIALCMYICIIQMCVLGKRLRFLHSKSDAEILCIIYQDSPSKNWMVGRYI